ncbi:MAG TPA: hypothetical protein VK968_13450 [Roseimicrobium sp.]|nr:hypothetical protein [Roseimicrobium sp.]
MQIGYAKKFATQKLKAHGLAVGFNLEVGEGIWAKRSRAEPIRNREHQVSSFGYIREHEEEGGCVWRWDR